ncbi:MAG TPA: PQQ-binding-like beta-propeller repeat protein [Kofleriaceae bacterium]|nr:PQQ-binding-like beta-propeller repeat protein [Kofleriaceae bacterium]
MRRIALLALAFACGGSEAFKLTARDNDAERLEAAFARMGAPRTGPMNASGRPMAYLVTRGGILAFDLERKQELWQAAAAVSSKVGVGADFIAHTEKERELVARDPATGAVLWRARLTGRFVGAAADGRRLFYTTGGGSRWVLRAVTGRTGDELWTADSPGALGAPAARGGLVFSPFVKQWLAILDARTGDALTRIRGIDEEITFVRATGDQVFFGSRAGVFLMDRRAASGKRAQSTYGTATLPKEFVRIHYALDAFDPVQATYSAYDRNRILWNAHREGRALRFDGGRVVVHTYRFMFGFDARSGALAWAYSHPRNDLVGSAHLGAAIAFCSSAGQLGALDPATGARTYEARVRGQVIGVTFDADGWTPAEKAAAPEPVATVLAAIARDPDARFDEVKRFAVAALAQQGSGQVTGDLVALIQSDKTPAPLYEAAVESLVARRDPAGLPVLVAALDVHPDYLRGTQPRSIGVLARAIASLGKAELDPAQRGRAVAALIGHLRAPDTQAADLEGVVFALGAIGAGAEIAPLRRFLLMYRADPTFASQAGAVGAAIDVLVTRGGPAERELVSFVAEDARSQGSVRDYASRALLQTTTRTGSGRR